MSNVKNTRFSTLYAIPNRNGVYVTKENHGFGIPIINMGELFGKDFIYHGEGEYVHLNDVEKAMSLLEDGDLLFARRSLVESGAGKCSIVLKPSEELTFESSVIRIRLDKTVANPLFYYYWFKSNTGKSAMRTLVTGSNVKGIKGSELGTLEVPLLSIEEQNNIASILWDIDSKIAINTAVCSDLEAMAKLLYNYWFVQFDFPDENGKPYKSSGGKMVWNEELKREIPEGWEATRIADLIYPTERGISYSTPNIKTGEGVPMLNLATFMPGGGEYKADGLKHYLGDYPENKVLNPYDLIMCNTQQTAVKFETDIIGRSMLVPDIFDGDVVFSHHVNVIRTKEKDLKFYLLYLFNSDYYHKYITGFTNGTNILGLTFSGVEDYITEVPEVGLLKKFGEIVLNVEKKKSEIIVENQQLASLRDFLLPMLMNGQVKVGKGD